MRKKLLLLTSLFTVVALCATFTSAQNPLAGVIKVQAEGVGVGNTGAASGTLRGDPMGMATWTYMFTGPALENNGTGGQCGFANGNITITSADGSTLNLQHTGYSCNTIGGIGSQISAVDNSVYIITSGTGRYKNAQGTGHVALSALAANNPAGTVYIHFDGNIDLH
jgi:predicted small secreted protein